jgi:PIN domain nuclease of toxin-antitoxin system
MSYLLDTTIFVWLLKEPEKLNPRALALIEDEGQDVYLSSVTSWEIVIKFAIGKLTLPKKPDALLSEIFTNFSFQPLPITHAHSLAVEELVFHHRDPFDRMLVAQAKSEKLVLLTADSMFEKYPVDILWCGK